MKVDFIRQGTGLLLELNDTNIVAFETTSEALFQYVHIYKSKFLVDIIPFSLYLIFTDVVARYQA